MPPLVVEVDPNAPAAPMRGVSVSPGTEGEGRTPHRERIASDLLRVHLERVRFSTRDGALQPRPHGLARRLLSLLSLMFAADVCR
jgi:hypothetical protein